VGGSTWAGSVSERRGSTCPGSFRKEIPQILLFSPTRSKNRQKKSAEGSKGPEWSAHRFPSEPFGTFRFP
jgi:hypothetical protein